MDLLKELKSLPESDHDLPMYFRRQHLTGNIISIDHVKTELFKFSVCPEGYDLNKFYQVVSLGSNDFVENSFANLLNDSEEEYDVEQHGMLTLGEMIELLELSINKDIPVENYLFYFSPNSEVQEVSTVERDQYSMFGSLFDCYVLS